MICTWRGKAWNVPEGIEMEPNQNSLACVDSPLDHFSNYNDSDSSEPADTRPSILITFQNSASYYTSYMGSGGTRGGGGGNGMRRHNPDAQIQLPPPLQQKEHPIVIMNEYPSPAPVSVAVSSRKLSCDRGFKPFSGPPVPQGPPKPPGPPVPNIPPSTRRESMNTTTLELPRSRRSSASPSVASSRNRSPSTQSRVLLPNNVPSGRPHRGGEGFQSSTMPRKLKARMLKNSRSMPTMTGDLENVENENTEPPTPSPRPSMCSSMAANSQGEHRPLMHDQRLSDEMEDWTPPTQPKPSWLSLNLDGNDRKDCRTQSVYVAEIWPSLVCILTAVLMTLIVYILVSYYYSVPHPTTRNRIAPSLNRPTPYPPLPSPYPYPYPYIPPPYDHYPPYQYPPPPSQAKH